jgi:hypothetical protein
MTDEQLASRPDIVALLQAVANGRELRGEDGTTSGFWAPYLLDGQNIRLTLKWLNARELVAMPMTGPPHLYPRGERIFHRSLGI